MPPATAVTGCVLCHTCLTVQHSNAVLCKIGQFRIDDKGPFYGDLVLDWDCCTLSVVHTNRLSW